MANEAGGVKKPSAPEIAALVQAFAEAPASETYRPLVEAYLALGRFMDAMVICKKVIKGRPQEVAPRVLLARIYAEHGKEQKAVEELSAVMALQPGNLDALRLLAGLQFKLGDAAAAETLLKAHARGPDDPDVLELMALHGIQAPRAPAATVSGPRMSAFRAIGGEGRGGEDVSRWDDAPAPATARSGPLTTLAIFVVLVATLGGWLAYNRYKNGRDREVTKLLRQTKDQLAKDTYQGYQEAEKDAQRVLDLDPTSYAAEAYVAYIDALRYGENGEGGDFLKQAQGALAKAKEHGQPHAYIYAAEAYLAYYTGDAPGAEQGLESVLHDSAGGQRSYSSDLLLGTLGIIQLGEGKLADARKNLVDAHERAPADVRVTAVLGSLDARMDSVATATAFFTQALQIDPDHVASNLGSVALALQANPPDVAAAGKQLDRLDKLGPGAMSPRQSSFAKFLHAQLLYAEGKSGPAIEEEKLALGLDPKNADMPIMMGQRLLRAGKPDQAIALFQSALALDANRPTVLVDMGRAYLAEPDAGVAQAIQQFDLALIQLPTDSRVMVLLGNALQRKGDPEHARAQWERATARDPDNVEAHEALAHYWLGKGDTEKTKAELTAVAKLSDGERLAEAVTELGKLAMAKSDVGAATELFSKAMQANEKYAPPYFYLGALLAKDGTKKADSKKLFLRYLELQPTGLHAAEAKRQAGL